MGDVTWHAVNILEQLYEIFFEAPESQAETEDTLFRYKIFSWGGFRSNTSSYNFETTPRGQTHQFMTKFIELPLPGRVSAHMFRKLYCTIFINQHEYPHLPALSQHLRHGELSTTQIYISSPYLQREAKNLHQLYDWNIQDYENSHRDHNHVIAEEMIEAKNIKLGEIIFNILTGTISSGGYQKYLNSIFKKLHSSVEFRNLDDQSKITKIVEKLKKRGHSPSPYRHGHCMVGSSKIKSRSKCWNKDDDTLNKDRATPDLCAKCPFSSTFGSHLVNLEEDEKHLSKLTNSLIPGTINWTNRTAELNNLRAVIHSHKNNLGLI